MITCKVIENNGCLKCGEVHKEMVLVGAFVMCKSCWNFEFQSTRVFNTDSSLYKCEYKFWLKKYQNKKD